MIEKLKAAGCAIYNRIGDPRTKNAAIVILAIMSAFGIIAPETATSLRDAVLSLAL
jgi:hypothetical protein